jgi:lipase chaperone LimK
MIKPLISVGVACTLLISASVFYQQNQPTQLDLNLSSTTHTSKPIELEKTLSKKSISALFNTPELTTEQAALFHASLPQSLIDSPPPSALDINEQGQLIINMKVKRLFEFYLSAMGEDTLAECILRIRHNLSQQLKADALATALNLLEGFLQYQNHIGEIKNDFLARYEDQSYKLERVSEMKRSVRESRSLFFSEQANIAFYKQEDEYDDYMLKKVAIRSDNTLTIKQKRAHQALLNNASPQWITQQDQQANLVSQVQVQEKALRENGGDDLAIRQLRVANYGEQGAKNLAVLDQQRAQWSNRVAQYHLESQQIQINSAYTQQEINQLLGDIRQQHFSGSELIRISALDKINTDKKN